MLTPPVVSLYCLRMVVLSSSNVSLLIIELLLVRQELQFILGRAGVVAVHSWHSMGELVDSKDVLCVILSEGSFKEMDVLGGWEPRGGPSDWCPCAGERRASVRGGRWSFHALRHLIFVGPQHIKA